MHVAPARGSGARGPAGQLPDAHVGRRGFGLRLFVEAPAFRKRIVQGQVLHAERVEAVIAALGPLALALALALASQQACSAEGPACLPGCRGHLPEGPERGLPEQADDIR